MAKKLNKEMRERAGLTQWQLAEAIGIDRSTISKWETGESLPTAAKLPRIAKVLNCTIDELLCS